MTTSGSDFIVIGGEDLVSSAFNRISVEFLKYIRAFLLHEHKLSREELANIDRKLWNINVMLGFGVWGTAVLRLWLCREMPNAALKAKPYDWPLK